MNETNDPLEEELAAFRPRELSPAFRRRMAGRLADPAPHTSRRVIGIVLVGGLAAAACLGVVLLGQGGGQRVDTRQAVVVPRLASQDRAEDATAPTLLTYRRALARSSDELDALLDRHAARARGPEPQHMRTPAFTRSDLESQSFAGSL
jgi:hypothetical protein